MLITHDMGVIAETCDRVAVLYAGRVAEIGPVHDVINQPRTPTPPASWPPSPTWSKTASA